MRRGPRPTSPPTPSTRRRCSTPSDPSACFLQPSRDEAAHAAYQRDRLDPGRSSGAGPSCAGTRSLRRRSARMRPTRRPDASTESWSAAGIGTCTYSRHKADVEQCSTNSRPSIRRPGWSACVPAWSSSDQRRRRSIVSSSAGSSCGTCRGRSGSFPNLTDLRFQAADADDIADAYVRAVRTPVHGAFNVAADPILEPATIARAVDGRTIPCRARCCGSPPSSTYRLRVQPTEPGWIVTVLLDSPLMDTTRVRSELRWSPAHRSVDALVGVARRDA